MSYILVLLLSVASIVLPVAATVTVWTSSVIALKIALTAGIVYLTTAFALNNLSTNQGEDGVQE